jgi:hypothetical protein
MRVRRERLRKKRFPKKRLLPVSQRDLANYLSVSPTLLSMTHSGRHGTRGLGSAPSTKLAYLTLAYHASKKSGKAGKSLRQYDQSSLKRCTKLIEQLDADATHALAYVKILRRRLRDMVQNEKEYTQWLNTIDEMLSKLPKDKASTHDRLWIGVQQVVTLKKLQKIGLDVQAKLEIKIEMEMARARVYRKMRRRLLKQVKLLIA